MRVRTGLCSLWRKEEPRARPWPGAPAEGFWVPLGQKEEAEGRLVSPHSRFVSIQYLPPNTVLLVNL